MILPLGHSSQYLNDYHDGLIPMGKGIGCELDNHLLWKDSQLNFILGHDNVGKSYWVLWYFLALMKNHELDFTLFMDENYHGKIFRDLITMYNGKNYKDQTYKEIRTAETILENYFKIVDNTKRYTPNELLDVFHESNTSSFLIDPFNGLKTAMNYSDNYEVLNDFKMFTKKERKTIYVNAHPATASGRRLAEYPKKHDFVGHIMPPVKADIEGGKPFANKADDFIIVHRLLKHETLWKYTMIEVDKVKDMDTGGKPTTLNNPVMCHYNFGHGFLIGDKNPLKNGEEIKRKPIDLANGFDFHKQNEF